MTKKKAFLIFSVRKTGFGQFEAHFRIFDDKKNLVKEGDTPFKFAVLRHISASELRSKIGYSIISRFLDRQNYSVAVSCLNTRDGLLAMVNDYNQKYKEQVAMKEKADDVKKENPKEEVSESVVQQEEKPQTERMYQVVLINGNFTIVKAKVPYMTREEAKEKLFELCMEE